jgi:HK97 family phage prohead protease
MTAVQRAERVPFVSRDELIAAANQSGGTAFASSARALRKAFTTEVLKTNGLPDRTVRIRITTGSQDSQGDTIDPKGWKLANYRKNPVVLFGHDYHSLPVARDEGITVDELGLIGTPRFTTAEENPFGDLVFRQVKGGFLNAASVGFAPEKWTFNEQTGGIDFQEQTLLEYSLVVVPANAEALVIARSMLAGDDEILLELAEEEAVYQLDAGLAQALHQLAAEARSHREDDVLVDGLRLPRGEFASMVGEAVSHAFDRRTRALTGRLD